MSRAFSILGVLAIGLFGACEARDEGAAEEPLVGDTLEQTAAPAEGPAALDTPEAKIESAESAAPPEIAKNATIMDWPAEEGGQPTELRAGTNGWTCFPTMPETASAADEDPMCLDGEWLKFAQAWLGKTQPSVSAVGIGYMLQGDAGVSNTDPYATERTDDNQWVEAGPHLMVITPDASQLAALSTDPENGGPWVMWPGTPYAHIMLPVEGSD